MQVAEPSGSAKAKEKAPRRRFAFGLAAIVVVGLCLRVFGLGGQPLSEDDKYVAVSALNYVETGHLGPTMWNHPNLRNLVVYASTWLAGGGVWALKAPSFLFGSLSILLIGLVARRLLGRDDVACLAALFLAIDPLHIDFSRQAVHEVYMTFFALLGLLLALKSLERIRPAYLVLAGLTFGLGLAAKWSVVFALVPTGVYLVHRHVWRCPARDQRFANAALLVACLALLPFTVQLLTYLPWHARGYGLGDWINLQFAMLSETRLHRGYNPYQQELDIKALYWFLKPVGYADYIAGKTQPTILLGISSPPVWLLTLPAIGYLSWKAIKERVGSWLFLASLFWCSYLPFILTRRPIWAHTAFAVLPFAFIAIAHGLLQFTRGRRYGRTILYAYLAIVLLVAVPLYLLASGHGLEIEMLRPLTMIYRPAFEH